MVQRSWSYMNDGQRTDIFLRYSAETIACACLFLAARVEQVGLINRLIDIDLQIPLPLQPRPWWELFDVDKGDLIEISLVLLRQYKRTKSPSWSRIDREVALLRDAYTKSQDDKLKVNNHRYVFTSPNFQ